MAEKLCVLCGDPTPGPRRSYCRPCDNERSHMLRNGEIPECTRTGEVRRYGYPLNAAQDLDDFVAGLLPVSDLCAKYGAHEQTVKKWAKRRAGKGFNLRSETYGKGYPDSLVPLFRRIAARKLSVSKAADKVPEVHSKTFDRWWRAWRDTQGIAPLREKYHERAKPVRGGWPRELEPRFRAVVQGNDTLKQIAIDLDRSYSTMRQWWKRWRLANRVPSRIVEPMSVGPDKASYGPFTDRQKRLAVERFREAQIVGDDIEDLARDLGIPARYLYRWAEEAQFRKAG